MSSKIEVVAYANGDELSNLLDDRTAAVAGIADGWRGTGLVRLSDHQSEVDRLTEWARANQQLAQGAMDKLIDALTDCDRLKMHLADHRTTLDAMSSCADSAAPVVERQPVDVPVVGKLVPNGGGFDCWHPQANQGQAVVLQTDHVAHVAELQATIARLTVEIDRLKGEPVAAECNTCGGKRIVDDGELVCSSGGIPYENGPIKLVKDCPACTSPAPVSIVLPERFVDFETDNYAQGWNACLDQIKELNK